MNKYLSSWHVISQVVNDTSIPLKASSVALQEIALLLRFLLEWWKYWKWFKYFVLNYSICKQTKMLLNTVGLLLVEGLERRIHEVKYSLLCTVRALTRAVCSVTAVHCKMLCIFSFPVLIYFHFLCLLLLTERQTFLHYFEIKISLIKLIKLLVTAQQNASFYWHP